jgi:hypothetical protein
VPTILEILDPPPQNDCGGCTACCDVLGVRELGKPYYARCSHLKVGCGCGIYDGRPHTCSHYRCAWHLSLFKDEPDLRPDRSGILMHIEPEREECFLEVYEVAAGALLRHGAGLRRMIERVVSNERVQRLRAGHPFVRIYPFGSDIGVRFPISDLYEYQPPSPDAGVPMWSANAMSPEETFHGKLRAFLMPRK